MGPSRDRQDLTALVTGAGGFVGRYLISTLETETSWSLIGVELKSVPVGARTQVLACDLRDRDLIQRVINRYKPDVIFHLAAQSYIPQSNADPASTIVTNTTSQINLCEACRRASLDPVILVIGSAEEYGFASESDMPLTEDQPFRPGNPYAVSKIAQDMLGFQYYQSYGMKIIRMRPFNHIGPGQSDRFAVSSFARQIAQIEAGGIESTILTGDLEPRRDFLDVRDVVEAYLLAAEHAEPGEVYNLASGNAWRIGDVLDILIGLSDVSISVKRDPARMRPSDLPLLVGDATRFRNATGWAPTIPLQTSLRDTLTYWRGETRRSDLQDGVKAS